MNLLIIGGTIFAKNRGVAAITKGCVVCLRKSLKNPQITIIHSFVESYYPRRTAYLKNVKVVLDTEESFRNVALRIFIAILYKMLSFFRVKAKILLYDRVLKEYENADIVINLSYGDMFAYTKDLYSKRVFLTLAYHCMLAILFNKPLFFFPQSIGPFYGKFYRFLARFILNQCDVVMVREKISYGYLLEMKVATSIFLVPDLSFVVKPVSNKRVFEILSKEKVELNRPLVGFALRDNLYPRLSEISKVIDYLNSNMNTGVVFIPHDSKTVNYCNDPRVIARKLLKKVNVKRQNSVVEGDYTVEELRGLIGKCDLFIGAYMHANISALSMCVPTIAISYSHKTQGIMDSVGLSEFVLDVNELTATNLINKIEKMYNNIHEYREYLKRRIPIIREAVLKLGKLTPEL